VTIKSICSNCSFICDEYFSGFSVMYDKNASFKKKTLAGICIASYLLILPPLIFGIGYTVSHCSSYYWKQEKKVSNNSLPEVTDKIPPEFFVTILNNNGYVINSERVFIPLAGRPEKFERNGEGFKKNIDTLKEKYNINGNTKTKFQFKDLSTEQAINESTATRIALNFANEHHAGGGPGFHKEKNSDLFVYDSASARAQEESLCQRSNLMSSLAQLPHELKADPGTNFIRSYYKDPFDSKRMAYVSFNHLFAVQDKALTFYQSHYLEEPKSVFFVTSAAQSYGEEKNLNCSINSEVYKDAKQRIETHLLAAASTSARCKTENPTTLVELILGAFGCGAFAPTGNPNKYREMIASIYKELLGELDGFFDLVTFAIPTFGEKNAELPVVANHQIFKKVLGF
jgi:uncharacterized protein (TIGR02452 family)